MANEKFSTNLDDDTIIEEVKYNPLDDTVNMKAQPPNVNTAGIDMTKPIGEPTFKPPPLKPTTPKPEEPKKREPFNPEMKAIPKKETEMAADQMAELVLQGYSWMHEFADKGLQVSEKKLNKLQAQGEINLNAMIDYDYGKRIRAGDFFQEYNQQVKGLLVVSDEFKAEVKPVLTRVLAKRGIGLTDEQYLMYLFGKDIAAKSLIFFQSKSQLNYMIESIKQATTSQFTYTPPPSTPTPPSNAGAGNSAATYGYEGSDGSTTDNHNNSSAPEGDKKTETVIVEPEEKKTTVVKPTSNLSVVVNKKNRGGRPRKNL